MEGLATAKKRLAINCLSCWLELFICVPIDSFLMYYCLQPLSAYGDGLLYYSVREFTTLDEQAHLVLEYLLVNHLAFDCMWMFTTFLLMDVFCVLRNPNRMAKRCVLQAISITLVCFVDLFSAAYTGVLSKDVFNRRNGTIHDNTAMWNPAYSLFIPLYFAKGGIGWLINISMVYHLICAYKKLKSLHPAVGRPLPVAPETVWSESSMTTNHDSNYYYVETDDKDQNIGNNRENSVKYSVPVPPPRRQEKSTISPNPEYYLDLVDNDISPSQGYLTIVEAPVYATPRSGSNKSVTKLN
ncbi:hypothetical protein CHUAL_012822 [Chamberlinius hualienensis]